MRPKPSKPAGDVIIRREFSAGGVICRRGKDGGLEVVLVKPAGKNSWALPKGGGEPGETLKDTAVRECQEETGLSVVAGEKLGDTSYVYSRREVPQAPLLRIFKKVAFFLMEYQSGEPQPQEGEIEQVVWLPVERALQLASYEAERQLIAKARSILT